jgi:hypothetical protein
MHYSQRITEAGRDRRKRWSAIRDILHQATRADSTDGVDGQALCDNFSGYFTRKISLLKDAINRRLHGVECSPTASDTLYTGPSLDALQPPSVEEVAKLIRSMPAKSSPMDSIPTSVIKSCSDVIAPLITRLAELSFREGVFPARYKTAAVTPLLKKKGLDKDEASNYRPISNLHTVSKIIERLFLEDRHTR